MNGYQRIIRAGGRLAKRMLLVLPCQLAFAATPTPPLIDMTAANWEAQGDMQFLRTEGFRHGILEIKQGGAVLKSRSFRNGTIEFDTKFDPKDLNLPTVRFHRLNAESSEEFYLRPDDDCPAADDCIQYSPIFHARLPWDMYPQYQAPAPVSLTGWNHVRLVVSGRRLNAFVNGLPEPSLTVDRLQGEADEGQVELRGPARFANFRLSASIEGSSAGPAPHARAEDLDYLTHWAVTASRRFVQDEVPALASMPTDEAAFNAVGVDDGGLVNLTRLIGPPEKGPSLLVWLKTVIHSDRNQDKRVSFGYLRRAWVYVNGQPLFSGANLYYPADKRIDPDGRLSIENGSFVLPLKQGDNEIVVALSNDFTEGHGNYGWGMKMRMDDPSGISAPAQTGSRLGER